MSTACTLLFDLDGTLIDSAPAILASFATVLRNRGIDPVCELNSDLIGPPLHATLARITGHGDAQLIDTLAADFRTCYDATGYRGTVAYPGIGEALTRLHGGGVAMHIVTNKRLVPTLKILDFLDWTPFFVSVATLDSRRPPATGKSALLGCILGEMEIDRRQALFVGDTLEDRRAAIDNGIAFRAALWGYGKLLHSAPEAEHLRLPAEIGLLYPPDTID